VNDHGEYGHGLVKLSLSVISNEIFWSIEFLFMFIGDAIAKKHEIFISFAQYV